MSGWGPMPMRGGIPWTRVTEPATWEASTLLKRHLRTLSTLRYNMARCHGVGRWGGGEMAHLLRERVLQMHAAHSLQPRNERHQTKRHLGAPQHESARESA